MNTPLTVATLQRIAKSKKLRFDWNEKTQTYYMYDRLTGDAVMEYAPITIRLMTSEKRWREECNKLKPQSER